jgi:tryptophan synthase alpha chain
MTNRLLQKINEARRQRRKLFCAFLTLGYPSVQATERLIEGFASRGVDLVELGFPFSDPLADGPTIQFSSEQALRRGVAIRDALRIVRRLRGRGVEIPILFFSYLNPIYHSGLKAFPHRLKAAGFDGLIVPDCPPEEDEGLWRECGRAGIAPVFLVAPTTQPKRAQKIFARSRGFLYYVSVRGVTGAREGLPSDLARNLRRLHRLGSKPVLVGFGVSSPKQVKRIASLGDGVIVGSAIVERIRRSRGRLGPVLSFVAALVRSLRGSVARG